MAGFDEISLVDEPVAAAMASDLGKQGSGVRNVLVFDLGGGTLDVSLLTIEDGQYEIKATNGDTHLGGQDFDTALVDYCVDVFNSNTGIDLRANERAKRRLRTLCERAKRTLSKEATYEILIESLA